MSIQEKPGTPEFANLIRSWIHYDNLTTSLTKQASNSRKLRDNYEENIIQSLQRAGATNSIIKINSGQISVTEEKTTQHISMSFIETALHDYFRSLGRTDETENIMKYIKSRRTVTKIPRLKKQ
jgi:hypothetical protein